MRRGLFTEGNLHFKIDWASLVGSKFTAFDLFYFVFEGNFPSTSPRGGLYLEGWFNRGFFALPVWVGGGGGIFQGAYTWRGLFLGFYGIWFSIKFFQLFIKEKLCRYCTSGESLQFSLQPVLHCKCILGLKWSISELE